MTGIAFVRELALWSRNDGDLRAFRAETAALNRSGSLWQPVVCIASPDHYLALLILYIYMFPNGLLWPAGDKMI
jgi:hypothetical protein